MLWSTIQHNEHKAQHLQHNRARCRNSPESGTGNLDLLGKSFHVEIYPSSWESPWSARIIKEFWFFIIHSGCLIAITQWYSKNSFNVILRSTIIINMMSIVHHIIISIKMIIATRRSNREASLWKARLAILFRHAGSTTFVCLCLHMCGVVHV